MIPSWPPPRAVRNLLRRLDQPVLPHAVALVEMPLDDPVPLGRIRGNDLYEKIRNAPDPVLEDRSVLRRDENKIRLDHVPRGKMNVVGRGLDFPEPALQDEGPQKNEEIPHHGLVPLSGRF